MISSRFDGLVELDRRALDEEREHVAALEAEVAAAEVEVQAAELRFKHAEKELKRAQAARNP